MQNSQAQLPRTAPRSRLMVCLMALAVALMGSLSQPIDARNESEPPDVPPKLEVPEGHKLFLKGHAIGTQNYMCLPDSANTPTWTFLGPQATLFDDEEKQIITHFLSPNLDENGTARATWQHSRDTSTVWARPIESAAVAPGDIPWLLLEGVGAEPGPTGGHRLTKTAYIQRLNTSGGVAPSTSCTVGQRAFVPYEADYFFYKATDTEPPSRSRGVR
jgi:Protein of unknown function (DUF3455)